MKARHVLRFGEIDFSFSSKWLEKLKSPMRPNFVALPTRVDDKHVRNDIQSDLIYANDIGPHKCARFRKREILKY